MQPRILYVITSPAHKRVFESFVERDDMEQMIIGPSPTKSHFVPEDYTDFKLKNIHYYQKDPEKEIASLIIKFKPDIYVQPDLTAIHKKFKVPKKVYVSHGMIGNHVKGIIKQAGFNTSVWNGLDLYCGATTIFANWVKHVAKVADDKILLNALPQLDILYDSNYYNSYRQKILVQIKKPNAKKVILFIGFGCKDRVDFKDHNEDYFRTAIELGKIARQNNWLVMIKPRQEHKEIIKFLQQQPWRGKYEMDYHKLHLNPNVHFIGPAAAHIYRYYFADAFVMNGCSTAEVEVCAIQKPLFIVRTSLKSDYDPYNTITSGAAMLITDISELEHDLLEYFNNGKFYWPEKQVQLIKQMGIVFDGRMHERIQNRLRMLL